MSNIFILASVYYELILTNKILMIGKDQTNLIILLEENKIPDYNPNIKYYSSIKECVAHCNAAIIVSSSKMRKEVLDSAISVLKMYNIPTQYIYDVSDCDSIEPDTSSIDDSSNKPVVLILYSGQFALPCMIEWRIYNAFSEHNILFKQLYSPHAQMINQFIEQMDSKSIERINQYNYDVIIKSLNVGNNFEFLNQCLDKAKLYKPNIILFLVRYDQYDEKNELLKKTRYIIDSNVNAMVLTSRYIFLPNGEKVICTSVDTQIPENAVTEKVSQEMLYDEIISSISVPEGIVPIVYGAHY